MAGTHQRPAASNHMQISHWPPSLFQQPLPSAALGGNTLLALFGLWFGAEPLALVRG